MRKLNKKLGWLSGGECSFIKYLLILGILGLVSGPTSAQNMEPIQLTWSMFVTDGMVEQDVFVESSTNASEVRRIPVKQVAEYLDSEIYAAAVAPPFEPMKAAPTETYPKGSALGITLRDWLQAKGSGSYSCDGKKATIKANFQRLVPSSVYTMWHFIDLNPPVDPWQGLMMPAGKRDGSQSIFKADANGNATYELVIAPCLQLSGTQSLAGLAIAWHSDGKTYGFTPGGMGVVAHAQLMFLLPGGEGSH